MGDLIPDGSVTYRNTLFADGHAARVGGVSHLEARLQRFLASDPYVETANSAAPDSNSNPEETDSPPAREVPTDN